jgi:hypothetical protein
MILFNLKNIYCVTLSWFILANLSACAVVPLSAARLPANGTSVSQADATSAVMLPVLSSHGKNAGTVTVTPTPTSLAVTSTPTPSTNTGDTTSKIVTTAESFLATLDSTQRSKVLFDFSNDTQRAKWSNFPTGIFQRNGLRMGDLSQTQRNAVMAILSVTLSSKGYQQIVNQITADEVLKNSSGGGNLIFGQAEYYISILGTPSNSSPWMFQFGGHHMAINVTIVGSNVTLAPSLTGGQPVRYTSNGQSIQTVVNEVEKAYQLIASLTASQLSKAVIGSQVIDLVLGPGQDGKKISPQGILVTELSTAQQTVLLELLNARVGILNDEDAEQRMQEIRNNLSQTYFAWSGSTTIGSAAYFRIQGPTVVMEFSPQAMGGDATNHIHSMYRDPQNDYGAKWR